jgi:hypothetical protein
VQRELVLRLASLLWRLRRATTVETGLFEIQADHLAGLKQPAQVGPASREVVYALFGRADSGNFNPDPASQGEAYEAEDIVGPALLVIEAPPRRLVLRFDPLC